MMLWTAPDPAPNPRRVSLFLRAKGLTLPTTLLSLMKREHKAAGVLDKNPRGQVPFLVLDDGTVIAESVSICRYLDELHPHPPLFGETPLERAETDMWTRRVETALGVPVAMFWQNSHPLTAALVQQVPEFGAISRDRALDALRWFGGQLQGRKFLAGDRFTMADIILLTTVDFAAWIGIGLGIEIESDGGALDGWRQRVAEHLAL